MSIIYLYYIIISIYLYLLSISYIVTLTYSYSSSSSYLQSELLASPTAQGPPVRYPGPTAAAWTAHAHPGHRDAKRPGPGSGDISKYTRMAPACRSASRSCTETPSYSLDRGEHPWKETTGDAFYGLSPSLRTSTVCSVASMAGDRRREDPSFSSRALQTTLPLT